MSRTYTPPPIVARTIRPQQQPNTLTPDTDVTVLFRGGPAIVDMYDQKDYIIPPRPDGVELADWRERLHPAEHFRMPYGVAEHIKARAVVPGTRDPNNYRKMVSQLAIVDPEHPIDPRERCVPFTPAQLATYYGDAYRAGEAEGLNRSLVKGAEDARLVDVSTVVHAALAEGRDVEGELESAAAADVTRSDGAEALDAVREGEAAASREGIRTSRTRRGAAFKD